MDTNTTTQLETVSRLFRDGWGLDTIAREIKKTKIHVMADLRKLRDLAGVNTNAELRDALKGWKA